MVDEYFCHVCSRKVDTRLEDLELKCQICSSSFVERVDPQDAPETFYATRSSNNNPNNNESQNETDGTTRESRNPEGNLLAQALTRFLGSVLGGVATDFESNRNTGDSSSNQRPIAMDPANYAFGNERFEMILHRIFQMGESSSTPTSKDVIKSLPMKKIDDQDLKDSTMECVICKDDFEIGNDCLQLPCNHVFHPLCITTWLDAHNTCPICRAVLPAANANDSNTTETTTTTTTTPSS